MATATLCRGALRRTAAPLTIGLSSGLFLAHRQHQRHPVRLDALPASRPSSPATSRSVAESEDWLDPEMIRQLSGGSLAGMQATHSSLVTPRPEPIHPVMGSCEKSDAYLL